MNGSLGARESGIGVQWACGGRERGAGEVWGGFVAWIVRGWWGDAARFPERTGDEGGPGEVAKDREGVRKVGREAKQCVGRR